MDEHNTYLLSKSTASSKVLIDANVLIFAQNAFKELGYPHMLNFLDGLHGQIDWFVASCVATKLHNGGSYDARIFTNHILNCDAVDMKMDQYPFIKNDDSLAFVKLNSLAGDDWAQVCLAHNFPELIVVTNDSAMFKTAHAVLKGRAMTFYNLLNAITPNYTDDDEWLKILRWFDENTEPLRNNSSWVIDNQK